MIDRFSQFPKHLAERAKSTRLAGVPVVLAHPDWSTPAPTVLWMHGRTAYKELDPGRYLRWIRAGIAACSIDLPGHGERIDPAWHESSQTPRVLSQMVDEIDGIVCALASSEWKGVFDGSRLGIGGMSAGGMAALRRLCDPHPFSCAAVEGTTGWLEGMYALRAQDGGSAKHDPEAIRAVDASAHLQSFRPIPLLMLHSEADQLVPFASVSGFADRLRETYRRQGASEDLIQLTTWPTTGAPFEHNGFGNVSNDAKNAQVAFLAKHLGVTRPEATANNP